MRCLAVRNDDRDDTEHDDERRETDAEHGPVEPDRDVLDVPDRAEQRER